MQEQSPAPARRSAAPHALCVVLVQVHGRAEAPGRGQRDGVVVRVLLDDAVLCVADRGG
jgi:hypothetical protein